MATTEELQEQIKALLEQVQLLQDELGMNKIQNAKEETFSEVKVVPDSSWLVAIFDENDPHHIAATSSLGAIRPYGPTFFIPALAYLETISRLIRINKIPVKKCVKKMSRLFSKTDCRYSRVFEISEIIEKYKRFSHMKISKMHPIDFYIATEGVFLNARILTCDVKMYEYVKKHYKNIYFITDMAKERSSDLPKLIKDIQVKK